MKYNSKLISYLFATTILITIVSTGVSSQAAILWSEDFDENWSSPGNFTGYTWDSHTQGSRIFDNIMGSYVWKYARQANTGGQDRTGWYLDVDRCGSRDCYQVGNTLHFRMYVKFSNNKDYIDITCPKHGVFKQRMDHHLSGHGCPTCNESKGEREISKILNKMNIEYTREFVFKKCKYNWGNS